ncbi:MAG TPA: hypothetical protein VMX97_06555 [Hyphomicrobiaceae bacterium]|nr:hypothetical protein [Hyphomicrobiaceae bacterium]
MRKASIILAVLLSLPALLFIYQPSMKLGGVGLLLGIIGMTISPLILFGALAYFVYNEWTK